MPRKRIGTGESVLQEVRDVLRDRVVRVGQGGEGLPQIPDGQATPVGPQPPAGPAVVTDRDYRGDLQLEIGSQQAKRPQRRSQPMSTTECDDPHALGHSRPRSRCWALATILISRKR